VPHAQERTLHPLRVVLLGVQGMLRDLIVLFLEERAGVEIRAVERGTTEQPPRDPRVPDLVIAEMDGDDLPGDAWRLLGARPPKLLGIRHEGRQVYLYEMTPRRTPLGEMSEDTLGRVIDELRRSGRPT
jgi:hypothetical protein